MPKWTVEKLNKKKATSFPFMKSKANECKKLVGFVAQLCYDNNNSEHDNVRAACAWGLEQYYTVINTSGRYLDVGQLAAIKYAVDTFLQSYYWLAAEAIASRIPIWHFVPKFHMFAHLVDTVAPQVNPAFCTCYADEDLVGHSAKLAARGHRRAVVRVSLGKLRMVLAWTWGSDVFLAHM